VIEYKLSYEKGPKFSETIWLDVETNLPLRRIFSGKVEKEKIQFKITETYANITIDPKIEAKLFELPK